MDANERAKLEAIGIDVDDALKRFVNNDKLMAKFMKKFLTDPCYGQLVEAIKSGNVETSFKSAHTLKGVAGNLSMKQLFAVVSEATEHFRAGNFEPGAAVMPRITEQYELTIKTLKEIYGE